MEISRDDLSFFWKALSPEQGTNEQQTMHSTSSVDLMLLSDSLVLKPCPLLV